MRTIGTLGLVLALTVGCGKSKTAGDAGADAGADAGPPDGRDAGPPDGRDAGPPDMRDAGPPEGMDAGPPDEDAGPPEVDAGPPDEDAGPPEMDAGPPVACDIEADLSLPDDVSARLSGDSENVSTSCTADVGTGGPEHWYRLVIEEETGIVITTESAADLVVAIRTTCDDPLSEVACARPSGGGPPPGGGGDTTLRTLLPAGEYFVLVDVLAFGVGGDYALRIDTFAPADNAVCSGALEVAPGAARVGEDLGEGGTPIRACEGMGPSIAGDALYYTVTVPDASRLRAEVTSRDGSPMTIHILDGCTDSMCLGVGFDGFASYVNTSGAEVDVVLVVGEDFVFGSPPIFDVGVLIEDLPAHASCASAAPIGDGDSVTGDTALGGDGLTACTPPRDPGGPPPMGGELPGFLYYSATIPAGQTLTAALRADLPMSVGVVDACAAPTCLTPGGGESAVYTNTGTEPLDVILWVGPPDGFFPEGGAFELSVSIAPPPENVACDMAITVTDGETVGPVAVGAGVDDLSALCLPRATDGVLYYTASVGRGEQITAVATALDGWQPAVRILSACDATDCLASGSGMFGADAVATWTNDGPRTDVIIALGPSGIDAGIGTMSFAIGVPPYTESTIATRCVDMDAGAVLADVVGDDSTTAITPLPFTFQYFGGDVTHFSVCTNGFMQLWDGASGSPSRAFVNSPLPSSAEPNGTIAAYWDDLVVEGATATVRTLVAGTAPSRRFIVEWRDVALLRDRSQTMTVQVKLFERTGAVQLHYCDLSSMTDGSAATVGLEDLAGIEAALHSFDSPASVSATDAIVFTP